jgi:hypothetical protein
VDDYDDDDNNNNNNKFYRWLNFGDSKEVQQWQLKTKQSAKTLKNKKFARKNRQ